MSSSFLETSSPLSLRDCIHISHLEGSSSSVFFHIDAGIVPLFCRMTYVGSLLPVLTWDPLTPFWTWKLVLQYLLLFDS